MFRFWKRIQTTAAPAAPRGFFSPGPGRFERLSYLEAVAIVAAKLAKCDGPVKRSEIDCFKSHFPLADHEHAAVAPLFDLARESAEGFEPFVREILRMVGEDRSARASLLERFIRIGEADGPLNDAESGFLGALAQRFGLEAEWESFQLRAGSDDGDPYAVLGVPCDISDRELRIAWHNLIRQFHPDAAAARGDESSDHARVAAINAAYRRIRRARSRQPQV